MISKEEFKEALRTVASYEFADIPTDIPAHTFSPQFEKKMTRLINSVKRTGKAPLRAIHKTALIVAASFVLLITVAYKVDAIDPIIDFFTRASDYYISFTFDKNNEESVSCEYALTYIPEGFSLASRTVSATGISTEYSNASGERIGFVQKLTSGTHTLYLPKSETQTIMLDDITVYVRLDDASFTAYWKQDAYLMQLNGNYVSDMDTITDMLNSISLSD